MLKICPECLIKNDSLYCPIDGNKMVFVSELEIVVNWTGECHCDKQCIVCDKNNTLEWENIKNKKLFYAHQKCIEIKWLIKQ